MIEPSARAPSALEEGSRHMVSAVYLMAMAACVVCLVIGVVVLKLFGIID
jgi:hypothetical protein